MGLPGFGGGRFNRGKCLVGSQQQAGTSAKSGLRSSLREPFAKAAVWGSGKSLFKGEKEVSKSGSPGVWALGPSYWGQQPKRHILVPINEKCWELGVAGLCDASHCYLGMKVLVPLPLRGWSFPWVSYLFSVCNAPKGKRRGLLFPRASAGVEYQNLYKHAEGGKKSVVCFSV